MIQKSTPSQIFNLGGTYTTLPNKSLSSLNDATTLGMWALFISKPKHWRINKENVCRDLNIKPRQYTAGIRALKDVDLCREFSVYQNGRLRGREIIVVSDPRDWCDAEKTIEKFEVENKVKLHLIKNGLSKHALLNKGFTEDIGFSDSEKQTPLKTDPLENATSVYIERNNLEEEIKERAVSSNEWLSQEQQIDANGTNTLLAAADLLIGNDLTANQRQHIISQLNTFAKDSSIAKDGTFSGMGIDAVANIIGKAMLDPQQFKRCKTFEHKLHSILGEIAKGNFNRIVADVYSADADNQPDTTKPTPAQELQASIKRLENERQCQVQSLTGPMAQYPDFVSATQSCISKLDQDIADIQCELDALDGASPAQTMATSHFTADHSAQGGS